MKAVLCATFVLVCTHCHGAKLTGGLDTVDYQDYKADEEGVRIYFRADDSEDWDQLKDYANVYVDNGYEIENIQKQLEDQGSERYVDLTKASCDPKTRSITISLHDNRGNDKRFEVPNEVLFGQESITASVAAVSPQDKIELVTEKSHCFHGGSVKINKNGIHLNTTGIDFANNEYTVILADQPTKPCPNIQYDFTVTSRFGLELGVARISREDNKVTLDLEGKKLRVNTLDAFLFCTNIEATVVELGDTVGLGVTIRANEQRVFSLDELMKPCKESVLKVEYKDKEIHNLEIIHVAKNVKVERRSWDEQKIIFLDIQDADFQECDDMKVELQCKDVDKDEGFAKVEEFTDPIFYVKKYADEGLACRARVWIDDKYLEYAEWITILDPLSTAQWIMIGVGIGVGVLILLGIAGFCFKRWLDSNK